MTWAEFVLEPLDQIQFAIAVWEQEAKRDKLEAARQEAKAENNGPKNQSR